MNQRDKSLARRKTADGLPKDAKDWLYEDWRSLHIAIEQATQEIAERHAAELVEAFGANPERSPVEPEANS